MTAISDSRLTLTVPNRRQQTCMAPTLQLEVTPHHPRLEVMGGGVVKENLSAQYCVH